MPSLPLKVQVGIRDHWSKEDGSLQVALESLHNLLGYKVAVDPEWSLLLAELGDLYPDKTNFITIVAGCVQTWAKSAMELLEDEANEDWTEMLLDKAKSRSQLRLFVEASSEKASTSWSEQRLGFVISLPKKQVFHPGELYPIFRGQLLICFEEKKAGIPHRPAGGAGDDWADVEMDSATGKPAVVEKNGSSARPGPYAEYERAVPDFLPSAASLPRPDELLLKAPYFLNIHEGTLKIEIHCSHSPTLRFLSDYLKRWCRVNHNDTRAPPAVDVRLHQSAFGLGEMYDRLDLSTEEPNRFVSQFHITAPIVLALAEGSLGYKLISAHGGTWNFRRDIEFKSL